jgi:hypothetical protein
MNHNTIIILFIGALLCLSLPSGCQHRPSPVAPISTSPLKEARTAIEAKAESIINDAGIIDRESEKPIVKTTANKIKDTASSIKSDAISIRDFREMLDGYLMESEQEKKQLVEHYETVIKSKDAKLAEAKEKEDGLWSWFMYIGMSLGGIFAIGGIIAAFNSRGWGITSIGIGITLFVLSFVMLKYMVWFIIAAVVILGALLAYYGYKLYVANEAVIEAWIRQPPEKPQEGGFRTAKAAEDYAKAQLAKARAKAKKQHHKAVAKGLQ